MAQVAERQKDIIYSSRTRANTDLFRRQQRMRAAIRYLLEKIPPEERQNDRVIAELIAPHACSTVFNIVQLIYRQKVYENDSKDYEFSRQSMQDHWRAGYNDTVRTLRHPQWLEPPRSIDGVTVHDVHRDAKD
jgi:NTE family protein